MRSKNTLFKNSFITKGPHYINLNSLLNIVQPFCLYGQMATSTTSRPVLSTEDSTTIPSIWPLALCYLLKIAQQSYICMATRTTKTYATPEDSTNIQNTYWYDISTIDNIMQPFEYRRYLVLSTEDNTTN